MKLITALQVLAGTINKINMTAAGWYDLEYSPHDFQETGKPSWFEVKERAVEIITNEFLMLRNRIETLEDKLEIE